MAQAIVAQRVSHFSEWKAALVPYGADINQEYTNIERGYHEKYEIPIEPSQPFAMIFETTDWDGQLNILMQISNNDQRLITIPDSLPLTEVYIHPNGNLQAANEMAESITFPCEIKILD